MSKASKPPARAIISKGPVGPLKYSFVEYIQQYATKKFEAKCF